MYWLWRKCLNNSSPIASDKTHSGQSSSSGTRGQTRLESETTTEEERTRRTEVSPPEALGSVQSTPRKWEAIQCKYFWIVWPEGCILYSLITLTFVSVWVRTDSNTEEPTLSLLLSLAKLFQSNIEPMNSTDLEILSDIKSLVDSVACSLSVNL